MRPLNLVRSNSSPSLIQASYTGTKHVDGRNALAQKIQSVKAMPCSLTPIEIKVSASWLDKDTRPSRKYSPVKVSKDPKQLEAMQKVEENRISISRTLASNGKNGSSWLSFIRDPNDIEGRHHKKNTPAIVIRACSH